MRKTALLSVVVLLAFASFSWANFGIITRFVNIRIGPEAVEVRAPFVHVYVPKGMPAPIPVPMSKADPAAEVAPVQGPEGVPLKIVPPAPPVPLPGRESDEKPVKLSGQLPTIYDFAASFKPAPGTHEVTVIHPYTNRPVQVSFSLPEGSPRVQVKGALRRCIEFEYGKSHIEIWFYRDGRVKISS